VGETDPATDWLLTSSEPTVRVLARRYVLGEHAALSQNDLRRSQYLRALLHGQRADGGFGNNAYAKWTGSFWRVISLVELGVPAGEPKAVAALRHALAWLTEPARRRRERPVNGLVRQHASGEGFLLAAGCRLGLADEPTMAGLAERLVDWQWPDGGWNCDLDPRARRSSFHESIAPAWGLHEYAAATGSTEARAAAGRTGELLLEHRLFRSRRTGQVIHSSWVKLHYPAYYHYDFLAGLTLLARLGIADDPRAAEAVDLLLHRQRRDGRWQTAASWWRPPGSSGSNVEVVDWGRRGPNQMVTLGALRILRSAGLAGVSGRRRRG
jgi:hypothetical protein